MKEKELTDLEIKQKICGKNYTALKSHSADFFQIFKKPLYKYISYTGFDILLFDDDIVKSFNLDGISCSDIVQQKYGNKGVELIQKLLDIKMLS